MNAPGNSPFQVRGSLYLAVRDYVEGHVSGGMNAVVTAFPEGAHRDFAGQGFAAEEWYDALPLRPITEIAARLEGIDWEQAVQAHATHRAQSQLGMLGRMRVRSPERAIEQFEREMLEGFNFGNTEVVETNQARVRVLFHEVPQPLGSWFMANARGFGLVLLEKAGGKQVAVSGRLIPKGRKANIGLVDVRVDLDWA